MPTRKRSSTRRPAPTIIDILRAQSAARLAGRSALEHQLGAVFRWFQQNRNEAGVTDLGPLGTDYLWSLIENPRTPRRLPGSDSRR